MGVGNGVHPANGHLESPSENHEEPMEVAESALEAEDIQAFAQYERDRAAAAQDLRNQFYSDLASPSNATVTASSQVRQPENGVDIEEEAIQREADSEGQESRRHGRLGSSRTEPQDQEEILRAQETSGDPLTCSDNAGGYGPSTLDTHNAIPSVSSEKSRASRPGSGEATGDASKEIATRMLQGWTLLAEHCPR